MSDVTLYGFPISTYVRTARIALEEKGVKYDLNPLPPHDAELVKHQPFGKVPALKHGDFEIYETAAITRYVDEAFRGRRCSQRTSRTAPAWSSGSASSTATSIRP